MLLISYIHTRYFLYLIYIYTVSAKHLKSNTEIPPIIINVQKLQMKRRQRGPHFVPSCLPSVKGGGLFWDSISLWYGIIATNQLCIILLLGWGQTGMEHMRHDPANACSLDNTYSFTRRREFGKLLEVEVTNC